MKFKYLTAMFLRFSLILFIRINNKFGISKQFYKPFRILKEERNQKGPNEIQILNGYVSPFLSNFIYKNQ
jgi:hypothetical protein